MLEIEPGKEEEFGYLQRWLVASAALDRLIEATEPPAGPEPATAPEFLGLPDLGHAPTPRRNVRRRPFPLEALSPD